MNTLAPPVQRLRLRYGKRGDARFIGHLDVARFWERVFRRADLPLAYSHGFNPQPRIQFASALPVGVEGENELADVWLLQRVEPVAWLPRLRGTLPAGFDLHELSEAPLEAPAMQASLRFAVYRVTWPAGLEHQELARRVQDFLAQPQVLRPHHKHPGRPYDLRPLVAEIDILDQQPGEAASVRLTVHSGPQGNARAGEVVAAMGLDELPHRIVRTALLF